MRSFEHFVAIDWSGAKGELQKGIAVAICAPGRAAPALVHPERRWSRAQVLDWLRDEAPPDALIGVDLSPGLPFDPALGYFPQWADSPPNAKALWRCVDELCADEPHLAASRFVDHTQARRHFRHGKHDCGDLFDGGTGRLRETERQQADMALRPSSCFNLIGPAQVGKSSLTGMRVLHRLGDAIPVWPFDPLPEQGSVIVEIYTSLAAREAKLPKGRSKMLSGKALDDALCELGVDPHTALDRYSDHATDAILTAAWLRLAAADERLWHPMAMTDAIAATEGWTFGVP